MKEIIIRLTEEEFSALADAHDLLEDHEWPDIEPHNPELVSAYRKIVAAKDGEKDQDPMPHCLHTDTTINSAGDRSCNDCGYVMYVDM